MALVIYNTQYYRVTYSNTTHSLMFVPLPPFQKRVHIYHIPVEVNDNYGASERLATCVCSLEHFFLKKILDSLITLEYKDLKIILQLLGN